MLGYFSTAEAPLVALILFAVRRKDLIRSL